MSRLPTSAFTPPTRRNSTVESRRRCILGLKATRPDVTRPVESDRVGRYDHALRLSEFLSFFIFFSALTDFSDILTLFSAVAFVVLYRVGQKSKPT